ncbi:MAG: hypothetical protein ACOX0T_06440 [Pelotomaculum sp.]|jgi:hypothetical protein
MNTGRGDIKGQEGDGKDAGIRFAGIPAGQDYLHTDYLNDLS